MQAGIIVNPKAGRAGDCEALASSVSRALTRHGVGVPEFGLVKTSAPGDATRIAREFVEKNVDLILVCGGDGTVNEAIQVLTGGLIPLAVLPAGTANVLAKELQLPSDVDALARLIAAGRHREVSVGRAFTAVTGWSRYFLLMAGIGLDANMIAAVDPGLKQRYGVGSYIVAALRTLVRWDLKAFTLRCGGAEHGATFAVVANAANYAAWFTIAPGASMEEEQFSICSFDTTSRLEYLGYAFLSLFGAHTAGRSVTIEKSAGVSITGPPDVPFQLDGELAGHLPMDFECIPRALRIVC